MPSINYYTKDACEYNRQSELNKNGEDWSLYGDGSCILIITATPCVGSDIGPGAGGSGGSSMAGDPGNVSITGLLTGNATFSPHDIRDIENWINEFLQRNRAYGIPVEGMNPITSSDVPLTGNADFDRFYTEQMIRFEKPEQGGTVYLREGQNTIDPNDLKQTTNASREDAGTVTFVSGESRPLSVIPLLGASNMALADYSFNGISSPDVGLDSESTPGASFTDKALDLIKELTTNEYAEWVGNLTNEICSNASEVASILGNPDITSLSPEDIQRYDETTALYKASVTTVRDGLAGEAIGTITEKSVEAVEYVGEKASIRLCKSVDPDVVKADYRDGLELGKAAMDLSSNVMEVWGLFTNNKK
ncbi:hypothetical protein EG830_01865 [bacterium]|nr:hypothetical protein [bacterium]